MQRNHSCALGSVDGNRDIVGIVDDLINCDDTHRPAGKAVPDMTVIIYPIGEEFLPAAEYPVSPVTALDAECLIEPSVTFKNADKILEHFLRFNFSMIAKRLICSYHVHYSVLLVIHFCPEK